MHLLIDYLDREYGHDNAKKINYLNSIVVQLLNERRNFGLVKEYLDIINYYDSRCYRPKINKIIIEEE